jgi:Protein of unknown function (DUF3987)
MSAAPEVKWVPTHKKLKGGETVYTGDQGEWDVGAESPPGPKKEKSAPEKNRPKIAAENDAIANYNGNTTNQNPQLCADGLPKIVPIEEFEAEELTPPKVLDVCDKCHGEMAEPIEIEQVRRKHPDWQPVQICHCWDDEDGIGVQVYMTAVREVWAKNPKLFKKPKPEPADDEYEYKRIDAIDFPKAIHNDAFHGIAGEVVNMLCTGSELKPEAVLSQFLCIFGNMLGRAPYKIQDGRHGTLINVAIVGNTADGAKGSSYQAVKRLIRAVSPDYCTDNIKGGYNSSEALIGDITDEIEGVNRKGERIVIEEGIPDKRLLVVEEEFSRILQIGKRDGVTMSEILRQCFDLPDALRAPSRKSYLVSTNPFVSIVGHITPEGLQKCMDSVEAFNGFANRFMFIASHRTASIPEPPVIDWTAGRAADIVKRLQATLKIYCPYPLISSSNPDLEFRFGQKAKEKWAQIYHEISRQSANQHGYAGAIIARAKPTILRLSMIYSALDSTSLIQPKHLDAASALWNYATDSAMWSFEGMSGSKEANEILKYLKRYPDGVSRTLILGNVFRNNLAGAKLTEALSELKCSRLADMKKNGKGETWFPL